MATHPLESEKYLTMIFSFLDNISDLANVNGTCSTFRKHIQRMGGVSFTAYTRTHNSAFVYEIWVIIEKRIAHCKRVFTQNYRNSEEMTLRKYFSMMDMLLIKDPEMGLDQPESAGKWVEHGRNVRYYTGEYPKVEIYYKGTGAGILEALRERVEHGFILSDMGTCEPVDTSNWRSNPNIRWVEDIWYNSNESLRQNLFKLYGEKHGVMFQDLEQYERLQRVIGTEAKYALNSLFRLKEDYSLFYYEMEIPKKMMQKFPIQREKLYRNLYVPLSVEEGYSIMATRRNIPTRKFSEYPKWG